MAHLTNKAKFLLVDDDTICIMAMKRVLKRMQIDNETIIARDGQEAMEVLRAAVRENDGILPPFIVTLDINMPRMNGMEFLEQVRSDPDLKRLIVFVFSTSDVRDDIQGAYDHNVAGYLMKENFSEAFSRALTMLRSYARIVQLPV